MKRMLVSVLILSGLLLFGFESRAAQTAETTGIVPPEEVEQLRKTVKTYWDASLNQDWTLLYDFNAAALASKMPREEFVETTQKKNYMHYLSYELGNVEISGRLAWAEMKLNFKYVFAMWGETRNARKWQAWENIDGKWYVLEENEAPSRPPSERELSDEKELARRADEFWKAREGEQMLVVYELCDPDFRERVSFDRFQEMKNLLSYDSHTLDWVEAANGVGRVKVTYKYRYADPSMSKMDLETKSILENWIKVAGNWYRHIKMD